ncbi:MAG TPA: type IV pilin protein [Pseudomonadales bacterium]|nr:type IV pilin protein [Pseudomonadales bacterium]
MLNTKFTEKPFYRAFTLIELMLALAIVAIVSTIAYASYSSSILKSRRADAKAALLDLASREERYFSTHNIYSSATSDLGYSGAWPAQIPTASQFNYALTVTLQSNGSGFTATATPQGYQAKDACGTYSLDYLGNQNNSGNTEASSKCW